MFAMSSIDDIANIKCYNGCFNGKEAMVSLHDLEQPSLKQFQWVCNIKKMLCLVEELNSFTTCIFCFCLFFILQIAMWSYDHIAIWRMKNKQKQKMHVVKEFNSSTKHSIFLMLQTHWNCFKLGCSKSWRLTIASFPLKQPL